MTPPSLPSEWKRDVHVHTSMPLGELGHVHAVAFWLSSKSPGSSTSSVTVVGSAAADRNAV